MSAILVLLSGSSFIAHSQAPVRIQARWHLSWNAVDRGRVTWGLTGRFTSQDDCLAAEKKAIRARVESLRPLGNEVTEHGTVVIEAHRDDRTVLTVVHFFCAEERDWVILVAQQSRTGIAADDRIGPFQTEEQCVEALELEVDFKAKSLRKLGNAVSTVRLTTTNWTLRSTEATGTEAASTTYTCVPA
jgi:hypothetical protein